MAQAVHCDTTRRSILAGLAVLAPVGSAAAAPTALAGADNPDTKLFELFRKWQMSQDRADQLREARDSAGGGSAAQEALEDEYELLRELEPEIAIMPAKTLEGLQLKAQVVVRYFGGLKKMEELVGNGRNDEAIAFSIVRDLVRLAAPAQA